MLPSEDAERKAIPIWDGCVMYFPDALAEVAKVSLAGNEQHNPGEPLHWAREKSTDQLNTAMRHMIDHGRGQVFDGKVRHLAKACWRLLAELQVSCEQERAGQEERKDPAPAAIIPPEEANVQQIASEG